MRGQQWALRRQMWHLIALPVPTSQSRLLQLPAPPCPLRLFAHQRLSGHISSANQICCSVSRESLLCHDIHLRKQLDKTSEVDEIFRGEGSAKGALTEGHSLREEESVCLLSARVNNAAVEGWVYCATAGDAENKVSSQRAGELLGALYLIFPGWVMTE